MMPIKIDLLTMGIQPDVERKFIAELENMDDLSITCKPYNLFRITDLLQARINLKLVRADIVVFYWDILARPSKLIMDMIFPLYGLLGLQYDLVSRVKVPLIVLSYQESSYFIHADIAAFGKIQGKDAYLAESLDDVKQRIRTIHSPPIWGGKKVCIFGKPFKSSTIRCPKLTKDYVLRRTGVEVEHKSIQSLIEGIKRIDDQNAETEMNRWIGDATNIHGDLTQEIMGSCKLYLYLNELLEKNGYAGVAISCVSKAFPHNPLMPHPCLAFSRLRDRGVPAVCEADLCALLTAMLMEGVARKPSYMGNVVFVDIDASTVTLTHCATALKMQGYDSVPMAYSLQDYHDTSKGVVPSVDFPTDREVTLGLLSKDLNSFTLWSGTLIESGQDFCANMAKIKIQDSKGFKQNIIGCHYVMVYGNIMKKLHDVLLDLNISVVVPMSVST